MNFVQGDRVGLRGGECRVGAGDKGDEDGNLRSKTNDAAGYMCGDESANGAMDVARVGG